jgi:Putative transposase, YhgA-like
MQNKKEVYRTVLKPSPADAKGKKKKKKVTVVLLFEHKKDVRSYFLLFLQLLEYIIFIWRKDLADGNKPSIIIPIVVNQGPRELRFKMLHECFKGVPQELLNYIPNFHIHLTNVMPLTEKELMDLDEKGLSRSLLLAYIFVEDRTRVHNMITEMFKFFKHQPDRFDFFEHIFGFVTKEGYLSPVEVEELLDKYLSPQQKEGAMTSVQEWTIKGRIEGVIEGELKAKRLMVLRGKWKTAPPDFLADQSELPLDLVNDIMKGYNEVLAFWQKNKTTDMTYCHTKYLTDEEVKYLLELFNKHHA